MNCLRTRCCGVLVATVCFLLSGGCGPVDDTPELAQVSGQVTLKGQPLAGYIVNFQPTTGRPSVGRTDAQGRYVLDYTLTEKGAKVGSHKVFFIYAPESEAAQVAADAGNVPDDVRQMMEKYGTAATTPLTAEVTGDTTDMNFDITAE